MSGVRRALTVIVVAAAIIGVWWLIEDGRLGGRFADTVAGSGERPSWGDVADKVGEFAAEERGLRQTIDKVGPQDAVPAAD